MNATYHFHVFFITSRTFFSQTLSDGMRYRMIPNTKLEVSELCMGTMNFGDQLSKKTAFSLLDDAVKEYAMNFIVSLL